MSPTASLVTVDNDSALVAIAREHLGTDARVSFHVGDGGDFLQGLPHCTFDFIFADTWPGKFTHLAETLALLTPGAFYVIDDMSPVPTWPPAHLQKVSALIETLEACPDLHITKLSWSTGIIIGTKLAGIREI